MPDFIGPPTPTASDGGGAPETTQSNIDKVYFKSADQDVVAFMPNDISINVQQEYENPIKNVSAPFQSAAQTIPKIFGKQGTSLTWKGAVYYIWMGGSAVNLSFEVHFVAETSVEDVRDPVRQLMKMATPSETGSHNVGGQRIEGPLKEPFTSDNSLSVQIGNLVQIPDCLLISVNPTLGRPLLFDGTPVRVPVQVTIQSRHILTRQDVDKMFFLGG